jgi:hypothetical protein
MSLLFNKPASRSFVKFGLITVVKCLTRDPKVVGLNPTKQRKKYEKSFFGKNLGFNDGN